ncbi:metallophosphoesterase family protein [Sporosarcina sp. FSL K6-1540]|uniref:metallophosphoesterase family protein n=1 Tax=Sporosarcina sp. FSL K6-1540 TaxID=2921555 RepID=UPI003159E016
MHYALLGDIHSSKEDLEKVLMDISEKYPEAVRVGTGDLFECIISKKNITDQKFTKLKDVMIIPEGFTELLTFLTVSGNQEDRIMMITETDDPLREKLGTMPEMLDIATAKIIHGHQWKWGGEPWALIQADVDESPVFYGHSHTSKLSRNGVNEAIEFGIPYDVSGDKVLVNVGAVVIDREWALYNVSENTVTFMKA